MSSWIMFIAAYVLVLGLFRGLGGLRSAGEAFRTWGSSVATLSRASSGR